MGQLKDVYDTGVAYHGIEVPAKANFKGADTATTWFFNLSYTPLRDDSKIISGVIAYAYDVTEQVNLRAKEAESKLNKQAYDLFMQAPTGICIIKGAENGNG